MTRPSIFESVGGESAFLALASAHHELCLADPVLNHPFSHPGHPQHVQRLADYWAEVFGGPATYSQVHASQSHMLGLHSSTGAESDMGVRFVSCFVQAMDRAHLPDDPQLRSALRAYMEWAVAQVMEISPIGSQVAPGLDLPHWTWDGLLT